MTDVKHNPFKDLRLKMGLTQSSIADRAGVSKHAVLRLEQGCYYQPLPTLLNYFTNQFPGYGRVQMLKDYHEFQLRIRAENSKCLGDFETYFKPTPLFRVNQLPVGIHPLEFVLKIHNINPTQLAKKLCISQSTIVHFIRNASNQAVVPEQLCTALMDADYTDYDLSLFKEAYFDYRTWLRSEKNLTLVSNDRVREEAV